METFPPAGLLRRSSAIKRIRLLADRAIGRTALGRKFLRINTSKTCREKLLLTLNLFPLHFFHS
jgi:hypothetical protein